MAPWRGTWEFDGGAFMNQASHYVDMIQWLVGPVATVSAKTATLARRIESEDTGVAILSFRNGALGTIEVTMLTYPKNMEGSITVIGEKGTVKVGGTALNRIEHWEFARVRRHRSRRRSRSGRRRTRCRCTARGTGRTTRTW